MSFEEDAKLVKKTWEEGRHTVNWVTTRGIRKYDEADAALERILELAWQYEDLNK